MGIRWSEDPLLLLLVQLPLLWEEFMGEEFFSLSRGLDDEVISIFAAKLAVKFTSTRERERKRFFWGWLLGGEEEMNE